MTELSFTADEIAAGERLFARPWGFLKGVVALDGLPAAGPPEVAFAGRSNVGKSSLLNALVRQKHLARTSNTPGRTQELNYFAPVDRALYIVDMPGYGFARAPQDKVAAWGELITAYLAGRGVLQRVFLLVDARHGLKTADEEVMAKLDVSAVSYQVLLTKADKINAGELARTVAETEAALKRHPAAFPQVVATSAQKGTGIAEVRAILAAIRAQAGS